LQKFRLTPDPLDPLIGKRGINIIQVMILEIGGMSLVIKPQVGMAFFLLILVLLLLRFYRVVPDDNLLRKNLC